MNLGSRQAVPVPRTWPELRRVDGRRDPECSDVREFLRWLAIASALHDGRGGMVVAPMSNPERLLPLLDDALAGLEGHLRWHSFLELGGGTIVTMHGRVELLGRLALVHVTICPRDSFVFSGAHGAAVIDARDFL